MEAKIIAAKSSLGIGLGGADGLTYKVFDDEGNVTEWVDTTKLEDEAYAALL